MLGRKQGFPERRKSGAFCLNLAAEALRIRRRRRAAPECRPRRMRFQRPKQALKLQHRSRQPEENEASDDRGRAGGNQRIAGAELIDRDAESDHGDADQDRQNAERQWNQVHAYRGPLPKGWRTLFP